ncbi:MAG: BlaI/MecI/CopY family transcriptional regulator [Planctomycetota bacterium]
MRQIPKISESEWQVMKVLWAKNPSTANEVVEALSETSTWKPKTVKTLLNRLVKKKAVGYEKNGREYNYYPLVAQADCVKAESHSFLSRVYGGALKPMLAAFLEAQDLSPKDIEDLKRILDEKGGA